MATAPPSPKWTDTVGTPEARPRVLLSERMVVFAGDGLRTSLYPPIKHHDGFDVPNHAIFVAGPEDLDPQNEAKLNATLTAKLDQAKKMKLSTLYKKELQGYFLDNVSTDIIRTHAKEVIAKFSPYSAKINQHYNTAEQLDKLQDGDFSPYDLKNMLGGIKGMDDDEKLYRQLRKLMIDGGHKEELETLELERAQTNLRHSLRELPFPPAEIDAVVAQAITTRRDEKGDQRISVRSEPLEAAHVRSIESAYADIDKAIHDARQKMVDISTGEDLEPFKKGPAELAMEEKIAAIAHKERTCRPLSLAGYADPDLTIVVEKHGMPYHAGVSYSGQNFIQAAENPKQTSFELMMDEELMHQGLDKVYRNISLPYRDDKDNRKALLEKAIAADTGGTSDFAVIGLMQQANYNVDDPITIHQEVPVKILKHLDEEYWPLMKQQQKARSGQEGYPQTEKFLREVTLRDAADYLEKKPLPDIDDEYKRTPAHALQAEASRTGWKNQL